MKIAKEEYPELNEIAAQIFGKAVNKINAININQIETNCPYIRQYVLEMVIEKLGECVQKK